MGTWIIMALGAAVAGAVQTVTGFGSAVVLMLFLPKMFGVAAAPTVSTAICVALTASLAWKFRHRTDFRFIALPTLLFCVTSVLVIGRVKSLDLHVLGILFGAFLMALGVCNLWFADRARLRHPSMGAVLGFSAFSAVFSGLFSIGGPMMALCMLPCAEDHEQYVGNMQTLFLVTNIIALAARFMNGLYTPEVVPCSLIGIVFVLVGKEIGVRIAKRLNIEAIKKAVYVLVALSGVLTLAENLL